MSDEQNTNGHRNRAFDVLMLVMSIIGGGSGIFALTSARDWGALTERVAALERKQAQYDASADERLQRYIDIRERVQRLEEHLGVKFQR